MKVDLKKLTDEELKAMKEDRLHQHADLSSAGFSPRHRELARNIEGNIHRIEAELERRLKLVKLEQND